MMNENEKDVQGDVVEQQIDTDIKQAKFFAIIGYFSFLCFVPLYFQRGNKFAAFHGKQALVIFILEVAAGIFQIVPVVGWLLSPLCFVALGIISVCAILKVLSEEYWKIPFIGDVAETIKL